jgi:hypothetical protein
VSHVTFVYLLRKRRSEDPWPQENPVRQTIFFGATDQLLELTAERYDEYKAMADRAMVRYKAMYDVEFLHDIHTPTSPWVNTKKAPKNNIVPLYGGPAVLVRLNGERKALRTVARQLLDSDKENPNPHAKWYLENHHE